MAASIVVDIKAQITGYQEQIAKIQQALSKIKLDSSLGKELTKELENAQKMLNNLGKNTNIRLSSESGIDQLTDKLENAGEKIRDITQLMGQVKFEDLDVSKLGPEFTDILKKVQELQAALNQGMGDGIQKAINDSETLKKTFTDLGADITKISADSGLELLNTALKGAQEEAANAKAKVEELNGAIEQQSAALQKLEQSPFFANGFNLDSLVQQLTDLGKVSPDKMLDKDAFQNFINTWKAGLEQLPEDLKKQKQEIGTLLENLVEPATVEGARQQFENLSGAIKNILSGTGYSKDSILGGTTGASFVSNLFKVDDSAVNEAKAKIENIFNTFRESFTNKQSKDIQSFLDKGQIDKAAQATITALREGQSKITAEYDKIYNELNNTINEKAATEAVQTAAETNVASLTQQISQLETTITDLKQQFEAQRQEIADLKQKLAEAGQKAAQGLQDQAKAAGDASAGIMNNAREAANMYKTELEQVQAKEQFIGKIEGVVQRWFSVYAAVRMVGQAVRSVISTVQELDKTITQIAIVTNMTQQDLWGQMKSYTDMARQYATSISGVYEVSQLYYQQGLQTADVMALTEETLKMARISGLDYATATDYMTNAVRSFKMEMQDAQTVVDVYSEIAASSATSTAELATAMSKTASSAEAVGSSFQNTTAMMAVMIEATRESAENIGSAMKSIISRYGEMTKDPASLVDSEGEAMSLNKVDKALQTVGITIHDTAGQFRDFDDVIMELAGKWDTIDKNTQRYIATVMAGNRQQSRFLALVSNGERLAELSEKAANSQDAATLQVLKTMDSIEAKTQQLKTTLQSLYVDSGIENMYKGILDFANNLAKSLSELGTVAGIPIEAIGKVALTFMSLSNIVTTAFGLMRNRVKLQMAALNGELTAEEQIRFINTLNTSNEEVAAIVNNYRQRVISFKEMQNELNQLELAGVNTRLEAQSRENSPKTRGLTKGWAIGGAALSLAGTAISGYAANLDIEQERQKKAMLTGLGTMTQLTGLGASMGGPWGAAIGAALGAVAGGVQTLGMASESTEEKITRLGHAIEETSNKKLQSKDDLQTLTEFKKKYDELAATRNKDAESREEWKKLNNDIAAAYPELISQMDAEGNKIVDMVTAYEHLATAKQNIFQQDFLKNIQAEIEGLSDLDYVLKKIYGINPLSGIQAGLGGGFDLLSGKVNLEAIGQDYQEYLKNGAQGLFDTSKYGNLILSEIFHLDPKKLESNIGIDDNYDADLYIEELNKLAEPYQELFQKMTQYAEKGVSKIEAVDAIIAAEYSDSPNADEIRNTLLNFDDDVYKYMIAASDAFSYTSEIINNQLSNSTTEWINSLKGLTNIDFNDIQGTQIKNEADQMWEEYLQQYRENALNGVEGYIQEGTVQEDGSKWGIEDIYTQFIQQKLTPLWYKNITEELDWLADETINQLYKDLGKSARGDIAFKQGKYSNISDDLQQILLDEFDKQYTDTINNFKEHINELKAITENSELQGKLIAIRDGLSTLIGPEYLDGIAAQFENILNNTEISDSHKNLQFDGLMQIYTEISKLDENLRQAALSAAEGADFTSLTGIHDFIKSLEDAGIDLDATGLREIIRNFGQTLNINFETEVQSYIANVTSGLEDFDKALNSASKGMDFKTASELAGKLGKSLTEDFDLRDGQYFFSDFAAIRDKFLQANNDYLEDLEKAKNEELAKFNKIKAGIATTTKGGEKIVDNKLWKDFSNQEELDSFLSSNQKLIEDYSGLDISTISNAWQQWHQQAVEGENNFVQWLSDEYDKQYAEAVEAGKAYANQRIASAALKAGQISEFLDIILGPIEEISDLGPTASMDEAAKKASEMRAATERAELEIAIRSGDVSNLPEQLQQYRDVILELYGNTAKGIFDKMVSDSAAEKFIKVDDFNKNILADLESRGLAVADQIGKDGEVLGYKLVELTEKNITDYYAAIDAHMKGSEAAEARAAGTEALWNNSLDKLLQDIYKNTDDLAASAYENLISKLAEMGLSSDKIESIKALFKSNGKGGYTYDITELNNLLQSYGIKISEATTQMAEETVAKTADDILKQISEASSLVTKGTTSPEAMQKFVTDFNEATGKALKMQDLFSFSDVADGFTLNAGVFREYADTLRNKLIEAEMSAEDADALIKQMTDEIRNSVDIKGYLDSDRGKLSTDTLREQIENYYDSIEKVIPSVDELIETRHISGSVAESYHQRLEQNREKVISENTEQMLAAINEGGQAAVDAMREVSDNNTLSAEEIEAAYRGQVAELQNAFDQLAYKPGAIVSGIAKEILEGIEGFEIRDLGDGSGVIESTGEVVEAYREFYIRLHNTNEATVAELNEAGAKILETRNGTDEALAIDALGDAAHMSYQRLGEILAEKGIELSENYYDEVISKYIEKLGPNQIAITDFSGFAKDILGITDFSSPEYISAFKTYNDSLIQMNRQAERNIIEEVNNLSNAQGGDWVNLTQLVSSLSSSVVEKMAISLEQYGGILDNGILKLDSDANLVAIINNINDYASKYGNLLDSDMAQLADAMDATLKKYVSAINSGIKGELTNSGALELQNFAKSLDANLNLQFVQTQNGLKLAQQSATALYFELQKIDSMQAGLTFDALSKSLQETNENYKNISDVGRHILELQEQIESVPVNDARRQQFEQELSLAEQIYEVRSLTDDSSFNFMSNSLPDGFSNPINYWDSWGKAFKSMNEAAKTGQMGIQDFYNIVNEMNNAAKMAGTTLNFMGQELNGDLEGAANLITAGFHHIENIDGSGPKIALENLGEGFEVGADAMTGDVDTGIKAVARAQIKMLDSLIAMLEAIVKMQEIQIDTDGNGLIDFGELFSTEGMEKAQQWLDYFTMNFGEVTVDGVPLVEALYKQLSPDELLEFFNELNKIINDPDCDPATIRQKLMDLIQKTFSGKDIEIKDSIFGDLQIDTETMGQELYDKIMDSLRVTDQTVLSEIATEIGKHNEELGKQLQQIIDDNPGINLSQALKIAADLKEHGTIKENTENNTWEALYDGKPIGGSPFNTQEEANNALKDYITDQAKENSPVNEKPLEIKETDLMVNGEVRTYQTFYYGDQEPKYLYKGREFSSEEEVMEAVKTGTIDSETDKLTSYEYNGSTIEFSESHGLVVKHTVNADGSETYEYNNEKYDSKEEFEKIFNANSGETVTTVNAEGDTVTVVISETTNKAHKVEQKEETWTVDGVAVEGNFSSATEAVKAYEASHPTSTEDTATETTTTEISDTNVVLSVNNVSIKGTEEGAELPITEPLSKVTGTAETLELTAVTSASLSEEITSIPIDNIKLAPQSVDLDTANMPTPESTDTTEPPKVPITEVIVKPNVARLDTAEMPVPEATASETIEVPEIPIAEVVVKPTSAKLDTTGMGEPQADTSADAIIPSVPVAEAVIKPSTAKLDTAGMPPITPGDGETITAQVSNLTIQPTGTPQIASGVEGANPVIPAMTADVTNLTVNSTGQPTVQTGEGTNPTIAAMTADVTALTLDAAAPTFSATTLTAATSAGTDLATNVSTGLTNGASVVTTAASSLINTINVALGAAVAATDFKSVGSNIVAGIAQGMSGNVVAITMAANELATKIKSAVETKLGIASPSTVMATTGGYVAQGLAQGMNNDTTATSAATTLAEQVASAIQEKLDSISVESVTASISTVEVSSVDSATYDKTLKIDDIEKGTATVKNLTVNATSATAGGGLSALQNMDFSNASASLGTLSGYAGDISGVSFGNFSTLLTCLNQASSAAQQVWEYVKQFSAQTFTANIQVQGGDSTINTTENKTTNEVHNVTENTETTETHNINENYNEKIDVDTSGAQQSTSQLGGAAESMGSQASASAGQLKTAQTALNQIGSAATLAKAQINNLKSAINQAGGAAISAKSNIGNLKTAMTGFPNPSKNVSDLKTAMSGISSNASGYVSNLAKAMNSIPTGNKSASVTLKYSVQRSSTTTATGNMGGGSFAKGTSRALVAGTRKTLMGELGPELVVSNGRYFIAGQNGAEFVDLAKDAIVFNHKQTRRLFEQGMIGSRGRPITNENNAISLAKGRIPELGKAAAGESPKTTTITESISSVSVSPSISDPIKLFSMAKGSIPSMGPALASAAAALAALKELRAIWQSLLDAGAKELGSMAGRDGGGGKGGKSCFVAGTLVRVLDGYKNIEDIQKGDLVLSYNTDKKINEYSEVVATMIHNTTEAIYSLYIEDDIIEATGIHPFFVKRDEKVDWIEAENLLIGDYVLFADGTWHRIDDIEVQILSTVVYNFEVSGNHNYYVGKNSILVHNKKGGGSGKKPSTGKNKKSPKGKGGKGGKGGSGGSGGGEDEEEEEEIFAPIEYGTITEEIQRWYDLLRQIDKLEQDISYQQALRKKYESDRVANGEKIYSTYQNELRMLKEEVSDQKELATLQKSWYDAKRAELAKTSYAKIFTYNDEGLQQYTGSGKPGSKRGLDILEHLTERNAKGKYKLTTQEQLNYLKSVGFNLDELRYNDDGTVLISYADALKDNKVAKVLSGEGTKLEKEENGDYTKESLRTIDEKRKDILTQLMENFWGRIDGWRDELDSLYDSYNETATNIQENIAKQNEILQKLVDNEVKVEEDLYKAIESREQTLIDNLKKEQELLKNSTDKFIEGLNKQLSKEKEQYSNQKDQDELTKLQRQLVILQRSGGSATQIRSLQEQIDSKMQEDYFKKQEDSINTIKDAADEQIKRLEKQIDIQSEILEYQKSHGLLWEEVRYIMENWAEENIASSILKWDKEFKEKSDLQIQEELKEIRERIQIYTEGRDNDKKAEESFNEISSQLEQNKTTQDQLNKIQDVDEREKAKQDAENVARAAYKNAKAQGYTNDQAQEAAQEAYNKSLSNHNSTGINATKQRILDIENEGKEKPQTKSTAEKYYNQWVQNQNQKQKLTGKSLLGSMTSDKKTANQQEYYDFFEGILNKDANGNLSKEEKDKYYTKGKLDYKKVADAALSAGISKAQALRKGDRQTGYNFTKDFKAYKFKNGKIDKTTTLYKGTYKLKTDDKGNFTTQTVNKKKYYQLKNGWWVLGSTLPSSVKNDIGNLSGKDNKNFTTDKTKTYKDFLAKPDFSITFNKGTTFPKDLQKVNNKNEVKGLTKKKKLINQTTLHVSKLEGVGQNGSFSKIYFDKTGKEKLHDNYYFTAAQLKKIKYSKTKTLYQYLAEKILARMNKKELLSGYATGGMADFTGPAWLDGTKKKPEAVLNADQTRFLKEDLLGNSSNSLMSIVSALQDSMNSTYTSSVDNSNSVVIENISLNFEAGTISNDYDARRAGDTVVKEILKIARKTGNNSVSRR